MREYGYKKFQGTGVWTVGFEAGDFQPDHATELLDPTRPRSCWELLVIHSAELDAQLARIVPRDALLHTTNLRVSANGYVSPLGDFYGYCQRQLYAVSMSADGER
jgi:hypothetical protein